MSFFTGASSALEEALIQHQLEQRQKMLDQLARRKEAAAEFDRGEQRRQDRARLALDQDREKRAAQDSQRNYEGIENEREYRRASNLAQTIMPGQSDEATFNTLNKNGFAGIVQERPDLQLPTSLNGPSGQGHAFGLPVAPHTYTSEGGSNYQNARVAAQERAEAAKAAQDAAAARAEDERASREAIAHEGNLTRQAIASNKPPQMVLVDTVDGDGNHVKQVVEKTPGATFKAPEPAAVQSQRTFASDALPSISRARQMLQDPAVVNGYGPASGRALGFLRGTIGSTGNPELDTKLAETKQTLNMIGSGAMKAHFGARGSTDIYNKLMDELGNAKSVASIVGTLNAIEARMHDYAHDSKPGGPAQGKTTKSLAQKYGLE